MVKSLECSVDMGKTISVRFYTIPQEACGSQQMSWPEVARMVEKQLQRNFGDSIEFQHIEFMNDRWFEDSAAQNIMEKEEINFPFVLVDGQLACADKKVNIPKIKKAILNKTRE